MKELNIKELRKKTKEYHNYHGDVNGHYQKLVYDEKGYPYILTRFKTKAGDPWSAILSIDMDGDLCEMISGPREDEDALIEQVENDFPNEEVD